MAYFSWSVLPGARGVGALRQAGTLSARANSNAEKIVAMETSDEVHQQPRQSIPYYCIGPRYSIQYMYYRNWSPQCMPELTSKSNGDASVVQLSPFLGSIGGYTKDTADFRKQAGPRLLVLQYRAQHDHSIACVLPAV
ncbi:hypothetical protein GQ600_26914 [Phytophthora cactorum]|nr:hypothetical protein GQ600_26914 [Phytophthora cactorum]